MVQTGIHFHNEAGCVVKFQISARPSPVGRADICYSVWSTTPYNSCETSDCIHPRQLELKIKTTHQYYSQIG